jgi:hypothetical protein
MYELYRALPLSLTADCRALLYASFCIASFNEAHTQRGDDDYRHIQPFSVDAPREDITYYNMTMEELLRWNQPSVPACCEFKSGEVKRYLDRVLTFRGTAASHVVGVILGRWGRNA